MDYKFNFNGIPIAPLTPVDLFRKIDSIIDNKSNTSAATLGYVNLHGLYMCSKHPSMYSFYNKSTLNYIDGMPIILISKLLGFKVTRSNRMTFLDFVYPFFKHCKQQSYKVLWIGGQPDISKKGIENILINIPGVDIIGIDGYQTDQYYLNYINTYKPDIILLGLGMPRQEEWVVRNINNLSTKVIWCVGATIDYLGDKVYTPPRWSGNIGLEWFFRFLNEPRRLAFRYLIEPWVVLYWIFFKKMQ
ncbi:WecB/TagA/CpsF family glycosyltransferase [Larkinella arboricola]